MLEPGEIVRLNKKEMRLNGFSASACHMCDELGLGIIVEKIEEEKRKEIVIYWTKKGKIQSLPLSISHWILEKVG